MITREEEIALCAANDARDALKNAIEKYQQVGFGSHVTQPLRDALANVEFSVREAQS